MNTLVLMDLLRKNGIYCDSGEISGNLDNLLSLVREEKLSSFKSGKGVFNNEMLRKAFCSGIRYCAEKYAPVGSERFTGNDIAMFLEMEACELSDDAIDNIFSETKKHTVLG